MLLRASGERDNQDYDLSAVTDEHADSGVPHSATIRALTEAAVGGRREELSALRVADATGIPLDDRARTATEEMRSAVGIDRFDYAHKSARYDRAPEMRQALT